MRQIKLSQWAEQNGYTYHGAFNIYQKGLIPNAIKTASGSIRIGVRETETTKQPVEDYTVIYSRVSSSENKPNLDSQADRMISFCNAKGWEVDEVVKECASGLNDRRPKLQKIFTDKKATRIVVEHKDRLTRFGFEYIKTLFPGEVVVVNNVDGETADLMQDFVSLVTSFCARIYGKRRSKRKTESLITTLAND